MNKKFYSLLTLVLFVLLLIFLVYFFKSSGESNPLDYNFVFDVSEGVGGRAYYFTDIPNAEKNKPFANADVAAVPVQYDSGNSGRYPVFNQSIESIAIKTTKTDDDDGFYEMELSPGEYFIILDFKNKWCNNGGCLVRVNPLSFTKHNIIIGGG
jgi:hypothetical protein